MTMDQHAICRVTGFEILGDYTLSIRFDDGTVRTIDFEPVLYGEVFEPLKDPELFRQVKLVDYAGCLEWPTGADFDPETLHDWPEAEAEMLARRKALMNA
jgi:hypothetical protein